MRIDESKDDPVQFRKTRFPMPWAHGYLGPDRHSAFFKALALSGTMIPFHVLVGADGTILGTSPELDLYAVPAILDPLLR